MYLHEFLVAYRVRAECVKLWPVYTSVRRCINDGGTKLSYGPGCGNSFNVKYFQILLKDYQT